MTKTADNIAPDAGKETAVCGGSNIKAPMRLDFIRTLRGADESEWPEIYILRDEEGGASSQPLCFASESEGADAMWMKNTLIPLDMVFIRADGTIARVARQTEPMSTRIIASGEPVRYVLELNGGVTEKLGIQPGDRVKHPAIAGK